MKRRIYASILSAILSMSLLTGSKNNKLTDDSVNDNDETCVDSMDADKLLSLIDGNGNVKISSYYQSIVKGNSLIDLAKLKTLSITVPIDYQVGDLLWLNYCVNLEKLTIVCKSDDVLRDIYELPNLNDLEIFRGFIKVEPYKMEETLEVKNCAFLNKANKLNRLVIANFNIEAGLIESLTSLKDLYLITSLDEIVINYDIDYSKLIFLNNLIINRPYSIIAHMSTDEVNTLINNNVGILMSDGKGEYVSAKDLLIETNYMIDKMIDEININDNMKEIDKVKSILYYVLDKLDYDEEVRAELNKGTEHINVSSFYEMGYLYGALNKGSAICGNYASLFVTLCDRAQVSGLVTTSYKHAWNVLNIDDSLCYVDPTFLDDYFENSSDKLTLDNVLINNLLDDVVNIPEEINIENLKQLSIMSNKHIKNMFIKNGIYSLDIVLSVAFIYLLTQNRKNEVKRIKGK